MLKLGIFISGLLLFAAVPACADTKPSEIEPYIHAQTPYGSGPFSVMLMTVYQADLWTDAPTWSWNNSFALSLHYHMDIARGDLSEKSIEAMNSISPLSAEQSQNYLQQLNSIFPNVKSGDTITALYIPNHETKFFYNGTITGTIRDPDFAKRFLSIWLSKQTPEPGLREKLLSLSSDNSKETP